MLILFQILPRVLQKNKEKLWDFVAYLQAVV